VSTLTDGNCRAMRVCRAGVCRCSSSKSLPSKLLLRVKLSETQCLPANAYKCTLRRPMTGGVYRRYVRPTELLHLPGRLRRHRAKSDDRDGCRP
jgi:hypothetical protein